jgi:PEP-CTERM motif
MATMRLRTVALAAAIAGGMLGEALNCRPAQAQACPVPAGQVQAFACTYSATNEFYATLELFNSAGELLATVSTNGLQGSIIDSDPAVPPLLGGAAGGTTSYTAGAQNGDPLADYFLFDLTGVTTQTVASAELLIYSGTITNNVTLNLTGVSSQTISNLADQGDPLNPDATNTALYGDLMSGTSYGSFPISAISTPSGDQGTQLTFTFTDATPTGAAALAVINEDIIDGTMGFAGNVSPLVIPEPSTWVMMLAGFAGLGLVARRRAARRRAVAAAG